MMPSSQKILSEHLGGSSATYAIFRGVADPDQGTSFLMEAGGEHSVKRLLGCVLLAIMPDEGLNEVLVSLREAFDYYVVETHSALPPPVSGELRAGSLLPATERADLVVE